MHEKEFDIKIPHLNWIQHVDDPTDLCAHGSIYVRIADKIVVSNKDGDGWTLSATALNLLRTLERDYKPGDFASQLVPCCGFFLIADDDGNSVDICGCPSGFDWTVQHEGNQVRHIADTGELASVGVAEY